MLASDWSKPPSCVLTIDKAYHLDVSCKVYGSSGTQRLLSTRTFILRV